MDIRCYRIGLAKHNEENFLTCTRVYPPPELTEIAIRRRRRRDIGLQASTSWDDVFKTIESVSVTAFFKSEIALNVDNRSERKLLIYRRDGKILFRIWAKKRFATVLQSGRFEGDEIYWKTRLGESANIKPRSTGRDLRFRMENESDFSAFKMAWEKDLSNKKFVRAADEEVDALDESDLDE